ncbi:MAG: cysteine synthase A [Oscillospiraceae bacterium]|nr:cysteine synthase A [Clostridiales bacterium]MDD6107221.1 cysteine synthase A [Clostridiales bacterium]MDY5595292.1 cysteine synthase A [Oscillospiraceae bacterium]MDY6095888.1 cysteine synthase A [Oscillospiraceae bacterium]
MNVYHSVAELIGNTPLLEVRQFAKKRGLRATILVKLEGMNPAGSAKDRVALEMILRAEAEGKLRPGSVIIEPTSGNTGIGLASVARARGYRVILTMPDSMSQERRSLLAAYGAELVLTPGAQGMQGAVEKAEALAAEIPGSFVPGQFTNPHNPEAHYKTTGPEIWQDTGGQVDIFVATVGTGGTLTGAGWYLKEQNPAIRVVAVEPDASPLLSGGKAGPHGIQGIGANFIPKILDTMLYDEVVRVTDDEAYAYGRAMAEDEGILVGISSGAALCAAAKLAARSENANKTIAAILPDTGDRYLSTPMFQN